MSINKSEWLVVSQSVSGQRQQDRVQQQALYRVLEALNKSDYTILDALAKHGIPLDLAMHFTGEMAVPRAEVLRPRGYPFAQISPMTWAAFSDNVHAMEQLYQRGADPLFPGPDGRDPLWMSIIAGSNEAWDWLSEYTNNWSARTTDGKRTTRLMDAVKHRNIHAASSLIHKVDINAVDHTGRTALHYNLLQDPYTDQDVQIARLLIEYGSMTDAEDHDGVSPIALASTPEQVALMDQAMLSALANEAHDRAQEQKAHLKAEQPTPKPEDPTDPNLPQIQKPVKFKKFM